MSVQIIAILIEVVLSHRTKEIRKLESNGKGGRAREEWHYILIIETYLSHSEISGFAAVFVLQLLSPLPIA